MSENKLIQFINCQQHYKAGQDLDDARNNTIIFGTYNPPNDMGYINNYRFSINNNNKNNFLKFSKLLYEQVYNKILNPEYRTIPVGIELNGLHKIVIDIDLITNKGVQKMFPIFLEVRDILSNYFKCNVKIYSREPNKTEYGYKYGCHIIIDKYIYQEDAKCVYLDIVNIPRIKELIDQYGTNFIDPAVFQPHHIFWLFGSCKDGSKMYFELEDNCNFKHPFGHNYTDDNVSFKDFCTVNKKFNFYIDTYTDSFICTLKKNTEKIIFEDIEDPSIKVVLDDLSNKYDIYEPYHTEEKVETISNNPKSSESNCLDIKYLDSLLSLIDPKSTEDYQNVRLKIIAGVSREYNQSNEAWDILVKYLKSWNLSLNREVNYHINELKRSYFSGIPAREEGISLGSVRFLASQHNPEKYEEWKQEVYGIDWESLYSEECEFDDEENSETLAQSYNTKEISKKSDTKNQSTVKKFNEKILSQIVKKHIKEEYKILDDYINDRKKVLNLFIKYFNDRVFYLKYPANSVYIDGNIYKKSDAVSTFSGYGKIPGIKTFFPEIKQSYPTIDAITYMNNTQYRNLCDKADFIPINGIPKDRIIYQDGKKIVNTFLGYNPKIYSTEEVPDLSKYAEIIHYFIEMEIGNKISKENKEYIKSHPIWLQPYMIAMLNICGGIEYCEYFKKFIAQIIQEPNNLLPVGILFYSKCRQGKNLVIKMISMIVGEEYVVECNTKEDMFGTHSVPFENRLLVNINEASASEFGKNIVDLMKSYIDGNKSRTANRKNIQAYEYSTKARVIATTNNADGFSFDIKNGNARINAFKAYNYMPEQIKTLPFLEKTIDIWKKSSWFYRELYNYFNTIKYETTDILKIYETEYMQNIKDADIDVIEEFLKDLHYNTSQVYCLNGRNKISVPLNKIDENHKIIISELFRVFIEYCKYNNYSDKYSSRKFYTNIADTEKYGKYISKSRYYGFNVYTIKDLDNICEL